MMFPCTRQRLLPRYSNIPYMPLADQPTPRQRFINWTVKSLAIVTIIAIIITTICLLHNPRLPHLQQPTTPIPVFPERFQTVGLVFYGRRSRVEILDCYLKVLSLSSSAAILS